MKITIIGGGSHRVLGIMRSAMAYPGVLENGEINLYDLNSHRAEVMRRMLLKTPEYRRAGCRIACPTSLDEALSGSDVVGVIMPASSAKTFALSAGVSSEHGFISTDNVSPTGSMCAVRIASVIMDIARKMERYCPGAWLINFVNPVAVLSGMINNHTKIRALGVCQGFTNHLFDIPRLLGEDKEAKDLVVDVAGVNHLSFILKGSWKNQDLFQMLRENDRPDWQVPELNSWWNDDARRNIQRSVRRLMKFWRELGVLIFSTEPDGMDHLEYEEAVERFRRENPVMLNGQLDRVLEKGANSRTASDQSFEALLTSDLDETFWAEQWKHDLRFARVDEDIFVRIFGAAAGIKEFRLVSSRPNHGAIKGIKDRQVVEYSQILFKDTIQPAGTYEIPDVVHGLISGLSTHQTLLGDALATEDPELLAKALLSYPVRPYSQSTRATYRKLFAIHPDEIAPPLQKTVEFL